MEDNIKYDKKEMSRDDIFDREIEALDKMIKFSIKAKQVLIFILIYGLFSIAIGEIFNQISTIVKFVISWF